MLFCLFLLFLVLMVLKLTAVIAISWWLVTLPLWFIPAVLVGGPILLLALAAVADGFGWLKRKAKSLFKKKARTE